MILISVIKPAEATAFTPGRQGLGVNYFPSVCLGYFF